MPVNVRKTPCPYCGKRLEAKNKLKHRNNLARHLQNCAPFQREHIHQMLEIMNSLLKLYAPGLIQTGPYPSNARAEVAELERLHSLEVKPK